MDSPFEAQAFFEEQREALIAAARAGGGLGAVDFISGFDGFGERLVLYTLARQALVMNGGVEGGIDAIGPIADAAIAECEALLVDATEATDRQYLLRALHMLNFNLAADLAECWPDDNVAREPRHFARGLKAADYLLGGLFSGAVAPPALANDYWVRGMHQLSLGLIQGARASWEQALEPATEMARRLDLPASGPGSILQVMLLTGYLGIATFLSRADRQRGAELFRGAVADLGSRSEDADDATEAAYDMAQLEKVRAKFAAGLKAGGDGGKSEER